MKLSDADKVEVQQQVMSLARSSAAATAPERARWEITFELFTGASSTSVFGAENQQMSTVVLHTFSKICRTAASNMQDALHQDRKVYELVASDGAELDLFGSGLSKIYNKRYDELELVAYTNPFVLAVSIHGIGINKLSVVRVPEEEDEEIIDAIARQEEAIASRGKVKELPRPDQMTEEDIEKAYDELLGAPSAKLYVAPKKKKKITHKYELNLVNPHNWFYPPNTLDVNNPEWEIERVFLTGLEVRNLIDSGFFTEDAWNILSTSQAGATYSSYADSLNGQTYLYKNQFSHPNEFNPIYDTYWYYGPRYKKGTGDVLERNCIFVVTEKGVLHAGQNTNWKQRTPYFKTIGSQIPFRMVGAGIADNAIDNEIVSNHLMSLMVTHVEFATFGVNAVQSDKLIDPSQLEPGITPGMTLQVAADAPAGDVFNRVDYGNQNLMFSVQQIVQMLQLSSQSSAGVDTSSTNPSSRSRISAKEIQSNQQKQEKSNYSLVHEIDKNYLGQILNRLYELILQYDLEKPTLEAFRENGVITEGEFNALTEVSRLERFKLATQKYKIQVHGFRKKIESDEKLRRMSEAVQSIVSLLNVDPTFARRIDVPEFCKLLLQTQGLPVDKILRQAGPVDNAREENLLLGMERMVSVLPDDAHDIELPIHYELAVQQPNQALLNHIVQHIQMAQQAGIEIPPPPPELEMILFGPPPGEQPPAMQ